MLCLDLSPLHILGTGKVWIMNDSTGEALGFGPHLKNYTLQARNETCGIVKSRPDFLILAFKGYLLLNFWISSTICSFLLARLNWSAIIIARYKSATELNT